MENEKPRFNSFAVRLITALIILAAYVYAPLFPEQIPTQVTKQIYQEVIREDYYTNLQNYIISLLNHIGSDDKTENSK